MKNKSLVMLCISKDDDIINYQQISTSAKKLAENNGDNIKMSSTTESLTVTWSAEPSKIKRSSKIVRHDA